MEFSQSSASPCRSKSGDTNDCDQICRNYCSNINQVVKASYNCATSHASAEALKWKGYHICRIRHCAYSGYLFTHWVSRLKSSESTNPNHYVTLMRLIFFKYLFFNSFLSLEPSTRDCDAIRLCIHRSFGLVMSVTKKFTGPKLLSMHQTINTHTHSIGVSDFNCQSLLFYFLSLVSLSFSIFSHEWKKAVPRELLGVSPVAHQEPCQLEKKQGKTTFRN